MSTFFCSLFREAGGPLTHHAPPPAERGGRGGALDAFWVHSKLFGAAVTRELELESHGLKFARRDLKTVALAQSGDHLALDAGRAVAGTLPDSDRAELAAWRAWGPRSRRGGGRLASRRRRSRPWQQGVALRMESVHHRGRQLMWRRNRE